MVGEMEGGRGVNEPHDFQNALVVLFVFKLGTIVNLVYAFF